MSLEKMVIFEMAKHDNNSKLSNNKLSFHIKKYKTRKIIFQDTIF